MSLFSSCATVPTTPTNSYTAIEAGATVPAQNEATVEPEPIAKPIVVGSLDTIETFVDSADEADETLVFENDRVIVRKTLIQSNQVGSEILYEISLEILKNIEALTLEESIPETFIINGTKPAYSSANESLEANSKAPITWSYKDLKADQKETILISLTPMIQGDHSISTQVRLEKSLDLELYVGQPNLKISLNSPNTVELGDNASWDLVLTNQGSAVANNVQLNAQLSKAFQSVEPVVYEIKQLDIGASRTYSFSAEALTQGSFENRFHAAYRDSSPETEGAAESSTTIVQSAIKVDKVGPESAYVFKPETYQIKISNTGDTDLKNVRITDILSENYSVINPGQGRISGDAIGWLIPELPAGSQQLITTVMTSNRPGEASVNTLLKTENGLETSDQFLTQWLAVPGVTLSITDAKDPLTLGESTEYTIRVRNQGEFEPVNGQIIIDFSEHLKPLAILNEVEGTLSQDRISIPAIVLKPGKDILIKVSAEAIKMGSGRANLNFTADFLVNPVISQESTNIY